VSVIGGGMRRHTQARQAQEWWRRCRPVWFWLRHLIHHMDAERLERRSWPATRRREDSGGNRQLLRLRAGGAWRMGRMQARAGWAGSLAMGATAATTPGVEACIFVTPPRRLSAPPGRALQPLQTNGLVDPRDSFAHSTRIGWQLSAMAMATAGGRRRRQRPRVLRQTEPSER